MVDDLTVIACVAVLAPMLAFFFGNLAIPGVVLEVVLGVVVGPSALNVAQPSVFVVGIANMGLAMLMFLAGYELELGTIRGRPLTYALASWTISVALAGVLVLVLFAMGHKGSIVIGVAMLTTALGTLLPVLGDSGLLGTLVGTHMLAIGSVGEFGPLVLIALFLGAKNPGWTLTLLLGFAALMTATALAARRPWGRRTTRVLREGLHLSSQLPIRVAILLLLVLVWLASRLGLDVLLGAFAAGVIVRITVTGQEETEHTRLFRGKLEAIGFGVFVPVFFVVSGMRLELSAFGDSPRSLLAIPIFFALMMVIRGLPTLWWYRRVVQGRERLGVAVLSATGLPLITVVTTIGTEDGYIDAQTAAALVFAGVLSVLVLPATGLRLFRGAAGPVPSALPATD